MSDLIAPVTINKLPESIDYTQRDIVAMLYEIRMELRMLNALISDGLNLQQNLDVMRQDSYYNGSADGGTVTR